MYTHLLTVSNTPSAKDDTSLKKKKKVKRYSPKSIFQTKETTHEIVNCLTHTEIFFKSTSHSKCFHTFTSFTLPPTHTHTLIDSVIAEAAMRGADLLIKGDEALPIQGAPC